MVEKYWWVLFLFIGVLSLLHLLRYKVSVVHQRHIVILSTIAADGVARNIDIPPALRGAGCKVGEMYDELEDLLALKNMGFVKEKIVDLGSTELRDARENYSYWTLTDAGRKWLERKKS